MDIKPSLVLPFVLFFITTSALAWDGTLGGVDGAVSEDDQALLLVPNLENGAKIYTEKRCVACHGESGMGKWENKEGSNFPRIAGQYSTVILKQLADFRSNNRDSVIMRPFALPKNVGGKQAMADVAAYIASLAGDESHEKGVKASVAAGEKLYIAHCQSCHGESGEGNSFQRIPRIQGQHYGYLKTQLHNFKEGKRKRANAEMLNVIQPLSTEALDQLAAYLSHLQLSEKALATLKEHQAKLATTTNTQAPAENDYLKALSVEIAE